MKRYQQTITALSSRNYRNFPDKTLNCDNYSSKNYYFSNQILHDKIIALHLLNEKDNSDNIL
jgi:hypothetical protein